MAEPVNSVLLVDFDSVHRSLTAGGGEAAARFLSRVPGWLNGLQNGRLLGPDPRSFVVKRCYADPQAIGDARVGFTSAGFEVVDCAASAGGRGVDLLIAMDTMEHLSDQERVDEFVFLSGEPTLAPLLSRLKERGRRTAIYADTSTAQAYRALADAVLDVAALAEFLLTHDAPEAVSAGGLDRTEIEAFARRIHAATAIPLFSPRTFAELFRLLTEEVVANGYHFQTTAKNVAERLAESGRSVTRRQVVFIVKGLALKGHVFSTGDTPRKLAEVFREQARYLIESAGLKLDQAQERILSAWLVDRVPAGAARTAVPLSRPAAGLNGGRSAAADATPAAPIAPAAAGKPAAAPAKIERGRQTVPKTAETLAEKGADRSPAVAEPARPMRPPAAALPVRAEPRARGSMISPDDARAAIAAKIAQSVRQKPGTRGAPKGTPPAASMGGPASDVTAPADAPESIENSILAAIAEAVDVLVEDETAEPEQPKKASLPSPRRRGAGSAAAADAGEAADARPGTNRTGPDARSRARTEPRRQEGEDIGDEIQRIIASYNRNRKDQPDS